MISIIICSKSPALLEQVSQNIAATIGLPYEIIAVDNTKGEYGICAAYNRGAKKSNFECLCFMHEDILFHTQNWGNAVVDLLADPSIGLVGVIGSKYLVNAPAHWWGGGIDLCRRHIIDGYPDGKQEYVLQNPDNESISDVVAVDGVWLCTRRHIWQEHPFDEQTFPWFHFYDIDFSAQVFQNYRVIVTYNVLLEHFSRGNIDQSWVKSAIAFVKKWRRQLPLETKPLPKEKAQQIKERAYQAFASRLLSLHYDKRVTLKYIFKALSYDCFNRDNLWRVKQFMKNTLQVK
ncbi:glycosyltransferase [Flavisolibacter tropicus]|uniref:glycosyltransferase n=1 Tax=Flavisolibacter tropicus TaxID=1492898 RepID=UPI000834480D|nr:glycosyltransferase [Flavisolibacter tropicus]